MVYASEGGLMRSRGQHQMSRLPLLFLRTHAPPTSPTCSKNLITSALTHHGCFHTTFDKVMDLSLCNRRDRDSTGHSRLRVLSCVAEAD